MLSLYKLTLFIYTYITHVKSLTNLSRCSLLPIQFSSKSLWNYPCGANWTQKKNFRAFPSCVIEKCECVRERVFERWERGAVREREARERSAVEREMCEREPEELGSFCYTTVFLKKNETINRKFVICEKLGHIFESPIVKLGSYKINPKIFNMFSRKITIIIISSNNPKWNLSENHIFDRGIWSSTTVMLLWHTPR